MIEHRSCNVAIFSVSLFFFSLSLSLFLCISLHIFFCDPQIGNGFQYIFSGALLFYLFGDRSSHSPLFHRSPVAGELNVGFFSVFIWGKVAGR